MDPFVFIVGKGRSGTTLVRAMLTSHPDMAIPPETHFIVPLAGDRRVVAASGAVDVDAMIERLMRSPGFRHMELDPEVVRQVLSASLDYPQAIREIFALYARQSGKDRYGDKSPGQVLNIELLGRMFPESVFIHVVRDGRNVLLSNLETSFGPSDVVQGAVVWKRLVRAGRQSGVMLEEGRYCEVRYEDLVADPEREIRRLSSFCHLEFDPSMLRYFERADGLGVNSANHRNLSRPPTAGLRDWRRQMTSRQVAIFESLAGDTLSELGYEVAGTRLKAKDRAHMSAMWLSFQTRRLRWHLQRRSGKFKGRTDLPSGTRA